MKKTYVLDTNVLIQAPEALECFEENLVVLPLAVLEELDNLKKADGEKGENARKAIRKLEKFRTMGVFWKGWNCREAAWSELREILSTSVCRKNCRRKRWTTGS